MHSSHEIYLRLKNELTMAIKVRTSKTKWPIELVSIWKSSLCSTSTRVFVETKRWTQPMQYRMDHVLFGFNAKMICLQNLTLPAPMPTTSTHTHTSRQLHLKLTLHSIRLSLSMQRGMYTTLYWRDVESFFFLLFSVDSLCARMKNSPTSDMKWSAHTNTKSTCIVVVVVVVGSREQKGVGNTQTRKQTKVPITPTTTSTGAAAADFCFTTYVYR